MFVCFHPQLLTDIRPMTRSLSYGGLALVLVLVGAGYFLTGSGVESRAPDRSARPASAGEAIVEVDGMACEACAARLEESLSQMKEVRSATVALAEGQARLTLAENHGLTVSDLRQTVTNTGYQPVKVRFGRDSKR